MIIPNQQYRKLLIFFVYGRTICAYNNILKHQFCHKKLVPLHRLHIYTLQIAYVLYIYTNIVHRVAYTTSMYTVSQGQFGEFCDFAYAQLLPCSLFLVPHDLWQLASLMNSFISFNSISIDSLSLSRQTITSTGNNKNSVSFSLFIHVVSSSCFIAFARIFRTMLSISGERNVLV